MPDTETDHQTWTSTKSSGDRLLQHVQTYSKIWTSAPGGKGDYRTDSELAGILSGFAERRPREYVSMTLSLVKIGVSIVVVTPRALYTHLPNGWHMGRMRRTDCVPPVSAALGLSSEPLEI
nr:hypothetical protein CFP56_36411 [Quercus suber]